jgi:hypothetical protein
MVDGKKDIIKGGARTKGSVDLFFVTGKEGGDEGGGGGVGALSPNLGPKGRGQLGAIGAGDGRGVVRFNPKGTDPGTGAGGFVRHGLEGMDREGGRGRSGGLEVDSGREEAVVQPPTIRKRDEGREERGNAKEEIDPQEVLIAGLNMAEKGDVL